MNLSGKLLGYLKRNKDLVGNVATGSALSAGFGLMAGGPGVGLAYGLGDLAVALPLTALARKARPPKSRRVEVAPGKFEQELVPSGLETAANIGGSLISPIATEAIAGKFLMPPSVEPTQISQEQQIMQQMMQRQAINNLETPQAVAPGTQFQAQGIEQTFLDQYRQQMDKVLGAYPPEYVEALRSAGGIL